jgi:hypothetical protein
LHQNIEPNDGKSEENISAPIFTSQKSSVLIPDHILQPERLLSTYNSWWNHPFYQNNLFYDFNLENEYTFSTNSSNSQNPAPSLETFLKSPHTTLHHPFTSLPDNVLSNITQDVSSNRERGIIHDSNPHSLGFLDQLTTSPINPNHPMRRFLRYYYVNALKHDWEIEHFGKFSLWLSLWAFLIEVCLHKNWLPDLLALIFPDKLPLKSSINQHLDEMTRKLLFSVLFDNNASFPPTHLFSQIFTILNMTESEIFNNFLFSPRNHHSGGDLIPDRGDILTTPQEGYDAIDVQVQDANGNDKNEKNENNNFDPNKINFLNFDKSSQFQGKFTPKYNIHQEIGMYPIPLPHVPFIHNENQNEHNLVPKFGPICGSFFDYSTLLQPQTVSTHGGTNFISTLYNQFSTFRAFSSLSADINHHFDYKNQKNQKNQNDENNNKKSYFTLLTSHNTTIYSWEKSTTFSTIFSSALSNSTLYNNAVRIRPDVDRILHNTFRSYNLSPNTAYFSCPQIYPSSYPLRSSMTSNLDFMQQSMLNSHQDHMAFDTCNFLDLVTFLQYGLNSLDTTNRQLITRFLQAQSTSETATLAIQLDRRQNACESRSGEILLLNKLQSGQLFQAQLPFIEEAQLAKVKQLRQDGIVDIRDDIPLNAVQIDIPSLTVNEGFGVFLDFYLLNLYQKYLIYNCVSLYKSGKSEIKLIDDNDDVKNGANKIENNGANIPLSQSNLDFMNLFLPYNLIQSIYSYFVHKYYQTTLLNVQAYRKMLQTAPEAPPSGEPPAFLPSLREIFQNFYLWSHNPSHPDPIAYQLWVEYYYTIWTYDSMYQSTPTTSNNTLPSWLRHQRSYVNSFSVPFYDMNLLTGKSDTFSEKQINWLKNVEIEEENFFKTTPLSKIDPYPAPVYVPDNSMSNVINRPQDNDGDALPKLPYLSRLTLKRSKQSLAINGNDNAVDIHPNMNFVYSTVNDGYFQGINWIMKNFVQFCQEKGDSKIDNKIDDKVGPHYLNIDQILDYYNDFGFKFDFNILQYYYINSSFNQYPVDLSQMTASESKKILHLYLPTTSMMPFFEQKNILKGIKFWKTNIQNGFFSSTFFQHSISKNIQFGCNFVQKYSTFFYTAVGIAGLFGIGYVGKVGIDNIIQKKQQKKKSLLEKREKELQMQSLRWQNDDGAENNGLNVDHGVESHKSNGNIHGGNNIENDV